MRAKLIHTCLFGVGCVGRAMASRNGFWRYCCTAVLCRRPSLLRSSSMIGMARPAEGGALFPWNRGECLWGSYCTYCYDFICRCDVISTAADGEDVVVRWRLSGRINLPFNPPIKPYVVTTTFERDSGTWPHGPSASDLQEDGRHERFYRTEEKTRAVRLFCGQYTCASLHLFFFLPRGPAAHCRPCAPNFAIPRGAPEHATRRVCHRGLGYLAACRVSRPPFRS